MTLNEPLNEPLNELTYRLPQQRVPTTELPGPKSAALAARRDAAVPGAVTPALPGYITDADGGVLVDADDNSFIDLSSVIAVTSVGASNPAVVGRAEIMEAPGPGSLGGTYGGNPVAGAAALASIGQLEELALDGRARQIETVARGVVEPLVAETPGRVAEVRGRGAMLAVELRDADGHPDAASTKAITAKCLAAGVLVLSCGLDGNVIRLLPPLVISGNLLQEGLDVLAEAIRHNL